MEEEIRQLKQAIDVLGDLLISERSKGNIKEALDRAKRVRELTTKLVDLEDTPRNRALLAQSIDQQHELEQIYDSLEKKIEEEQVEPEVLIQVSEMLEGAQSFTKSGDIAFISGDLSEALFFYENAHEFNYLAVKLFTNYETLRELESVQRKLALLYTELGEDEKARNLYKVNTEIGKDLLEELKNEETFKDLAYNLKSYAQLIYEYDPIEGLKLYDECLHYRKEAAEQFKSESTLNDLAIDLIYVARTLQKTGKKDAALEYYEACVPVIHELLELNANDLKMQQILMAVEEQINKLKA